MKTFGPEELLACYRRGVFPMSDGRDDPRVFLLEPNERGIIPLGGLHISKSMRKVLRRDDFEVTFNKAFRRVIALCAQEAKDRRVRHRPWRTDHVAPRAKRRGIGLEAPADESAQQRWISSS